MVDIVERLRDSVLRNDEDHISGLPDEAADEIERLRAREARLQEALRPFNCVKGNWTHQPDDLPLTVAFGTDVRFSLTLGDFRRASAALGEEKK